MNLAPAATPMVLKRPRLLVEAANAAVRQHLSKPRPRAGRLPELLTREHDWNQRRVLKDPSYDACQHLNVLISLLIVALNKRTVMPIRGNFLTCVHTSRAETS